MSDLTAPTCKRVTASAGLKTSLRQLNGPPLLTMDRQHLRSARTAMREDMKSLFHFAFHVTDLDEARRFYGGTLGCQEGRSTDSWVNFDFFRIRFHCTWVSLSKPR